MDATIQLSVTRDIFDIVMNASQILDIGKDYSDQTYCYSPFE